MRYWTFATKVKLLGGPIVAFCLVIVAIGMGSNPEFLHGSVDSHGRVTVIDIKTPKN